MKTRLIATLTALTLSIAAGTSARAEGEAVLEWQQPGYVMEVVTVTAERPSVGAEETAASNADGTLAWQQPGYVMEVVVTTASRNDLLAAREHRTMIARGNAWNALGAPAR